MTLLFMLAAADHAEIQVQSNMLLQATMPKQTLRFDWEDV